MAIDLSSLNSIYSLLGLSTGSTTQNTQSTANFEDYLMNALDASKTTDKTSTNGLYDLISNSSNTSVLNGLMNSGSGVDALGGYDAYAALMGTNTNNATATSSTDAFSNYLQSSFQSTMMKNMNAAKAKLQMSYEDFVTKVGDSPDEAAKLRMTQMEQNIQTVSNFIAGKTSTNEAELSSILGNQQSINASDLLNQLQGNSTLLDALTKSNSTASTNSQDLLNQLTASGSYYQNLLNS